MDKLTTWLGEKREREPRLRQALKATIAACLAYIIAYALDLPQAFWAAVVAIFVTQANIGASLGLALDWFLGSLVGSVFGGAVAILLGHNLPLRLVGLALTIMVLGYFAAARPQMRIACVGACIIILGTPAFGTPLESAGVRIVEVVIGTTVAVLTMLLVFPSRAGPALAAHIASTLPLYFQFTADLLSAAISGRYDREAIIAASDKIRGVIATNVALSEQAQTEVAGFLADSPNSEALLTALRRLWHTELMLARVVSEPLPAEVLPQLRGGLQELRDAVLSLRVDATEAGTEVSSAPEIAAVEAAVAKLNGVVTTLHGSDALRKLPMEDVLRLMTLDFALEQLRQNLKDVANRSHELRKLAGARIPWRRQLRRLFHA